MADCVVEEVVEVVAVVSAAELGVITGTAAPAPITGTRGGGARFLIRRLRFAWPRC